MKLLERQSFFVVRILFVFSIVIYRSSFLSARTITSGPGDSLTVSTVTTSIPIVKQKSLIQSMNKEQLSALVDYLFEMDIIPADLVNEINVASAGFKYDRNAIANNNSSFPASDFYACWEINNLFPEKDRLKSTGDTSITLTLRGNERGEYYSPCNGPITSSFGWRDSTNHNGIDIDLNKGDEVAAAFNGMVRVAKVCGGFGNVVVIRHYNGLETVYGHLSKIKVKPGEKITAGQIIGLGGSTGHSTGSHLHFEVRFKGVPINPKYLISFSDQKLLCDKLTIKRTKWGIAAYPTDMKMYTIRKGDTVLEIAKRFGTTTSSIKEMNGFNDIKIRLNAGQVITVAQ